MTRDVVVRLLWIVPGVLVLLGILMLVAKPLSPAGWAVSVAALIGPGGQCLLGRDHLLLHRLRLLHERVQVEAAEGVGEAVFETGAVGAAGVGVRRPGQTDQTGGRDRPKDTLCGVHRCALRMPFVGLV